MALGAMVLGGYQLYSGIAGGRKAKRAAREAREEQRARLKSIQDIYTKLGAKYKPTGEYGEHLREDLRKQKQFDTGSLAQHFLRSGIGGVSHADVSAQYERGTGRRERLRLEDYLYGKYAETEREKARVLERVTTTGPSYQDIASAYSGAGSGLGTIASEWDKKRRKNRPMFSYAPAPGPAQGVSPQR